MNFKYLNLLKNFDETSLPNLPEVTLGALELFEKNGFSKVKFKDFKRPVVVGSGNAISTAKILFLGSDVIFADETNYIKAMSLDGVDGVLIFSASGEKHAPIIAKEAKKLNLDVQLITCSKNSSAEKLIGSENTIITLKNREPYTYNTSTYMGWILAKTKENPKKILNFILKRVSKKIPKDLGLYSGFLLIIPNEFEGLSNLFNVKFVELFGRQVARDVYTFEQLKHAVTVVPSKSELAISFGEGEFDFQGDVLNIPLPKKVGVAMMMAIGYYVIGQIQAQKKPYFKENIFDYVKRLNRNSFGRGLKVIVD